MKRWVRFAPLAVFFVLIIAINWRLSNPPSSVVESRLVGQRFPELGLAAALPGREPLQDGGTDEPRLVNLFASWCLPCIGEAPVLMQLKARGVTIDGIAVRDKPDRIAGFLQRHGDPFRRVSADPNSAGQLQLGSSGVPETFLVDSRGIIRRHHVGPLVEADVEALVAAMRTAG